MLTIGVDLDPILGNPDKLEEGLQDLELNFTWDALDNWLSVEVAKIEKEEPVGTTTTPCKEDVIPLPQEAMKPSDGPPLKLILAPINVKGPLESLLDGAPQHAAWHESQGLAQAFEGNKPFGEVHGYPLDLLNLYFKDPIEGEPYTVLPH